MPRTTQPVRLSTELIELLGAKKTGRSIPMEVEHRLIQSLEKESVDEFEHRLAPWPRAIGRLIALLANELAAYSREELVTAKLKVGVGQVLDHIGAAAELGPDDQEQARNFAEYLWLKMMNADQRTNQDGKPNPLTPEQSVLLEIRRDLRLKEGTAGASKQSRKE